MRISTVPLGSPDDAFRIVCACRDFDQPDLPPLDRDPFVAALAEPPLGQVVERYVAMIDGSPVGYLVLGFPQQDNVALAEVDVRVVPHRRRLGVGRALLEVATERARALGRRQLVGTSVQLRPDGGAFAEAMGAQAALQLIRSRLDLATADQGRLDEMLAEAWKHAAGYRLVQWTGTPPDEIIDDVAALVGRFFASLPAIERKPEVGAEEVRRFEAANAQLGRETFHSAVLRDERVAGLSSAAALIAEPERATERITLVRPEDRGHRLGVVLKLENLKFIRARRPAVRFIDTRNELADERLLAINRAIGFVPAESTIEWKLTV